ncbi:uncharacterized protein SPPG_09388 [Spizellomyces punctatus DAOM BR117]|uniref:Uncharacterized protein n=1 Tax=Spizellomyces punctatus (strain DAOM BR117) TaxID=645134 RepID=A0A0L0HB26_SPIPD|nr:hypothetical protein, variant 3 [Spizellomyces punctatus DAOM BR117]XP_016606176.1 hypothetical protein, variant 2 [Spizellomyces punctatus DAOM BR117]XP_016606177.1 hypothetical protein, variant 1 [Spizellomyces punctatus DAOM BR117]XP_016606178.1 uncharacterized protein SPPG_09388 [Spizellomyces punctatus DAOM BR117]KNC98135.1 hypothetical protein, variant 3 [Spizellomyces punctatus DAOM BR117]KNC98136.1 hypothetical protein, variant 2 [Spizellomyces punctatus DAOM BR117]KNC98137.1 hypot|eukprot:XP_016606175.1 hypothetical protein, variant 3 [Spizellomyces punctatus DAOM BR117]
MSRMRIEVLAAVPVDTTDEEVAEEIHEVHRLVRWYSRFYKVHSRFLLHLLPFLCKSPATSLLAALIGGIVKHRRTIAVLAVEKVALVWVNNDDIFCCSTSRQVVLHIYCLHLSF